jgi:hypothetical protein
MKRNLLIVALSIGTIGGFACGFASLRHHRHARYHHFRHEVTKICTDAVKKANSETATSEFSGPTQR